MTAYLVENDPRIRQFRERGTDPSGVVVVHTAESYPDEVGPDDGAENVARFIRDRTTYGSYHDLADSDSIVLLVPYWMQAYGDGTGSNPHAYHVSAATQAHRWPTLPREWTEATVRNMARAAARYARWIKREHGVEIPARRITREESDRRVPGFLSHAERDPARRSDPGAGFPWDLFLETYENEMEGDTMAEHVDELRAIRRNTDRILRVLSADGIIRKRLVRIDKSAQEIEEAAGDDATRGQVRGLRREVAKLRDELDKLRAEDDEEAGS